MTAIQYYTERSIEIICMFINFILFKSLIFKLFFKRKKESKQWLSSVAGRMWRAAVFEVIKIIIMLKEIYVQRKQQQRSNDTFVYFYFFFFVWLVDILKSRFQKVKVSIS